MTRLYAYILIVVLLFAGGLYIGWRLYGPKPAKPETYAASERQQDGSLVLERKPDAKAKPKQIIPKGGHIERVMEVVVKPNPLTSVVETPTPPCPPVTVDLSLVKMPDDSRRVVASSPNGEIVGGVDIPVESARPAPAMPKWAAGLSVNPIDRTSGLFIDRDLGPFRIGVELNKPSTGFDARIKAGVRF